jgi:hypothetical protein
LAEPPVYTFVETTAFTTKIAKLGLDGVLRDLQLELLANPEKGALEPGTGGLRKVRMADPTRGQGKSYGARVHYAVAEGRRTIYLIFIYAKDDQSKLSSVQRRELRKHLRVILEEP